MIGPNDVYFIALFALAYSLGAALIMEKIGNPKRLASLQKQSAEIQKRLQDALASKDERRIEAATKEYDQTLLPIMQETLVLQFKPMVFILLYLMAFTSTHLNFLEQPGFAWPHGAQIAQAGSSADMLSQFLESGNSSNHFAAGPNGTLELVGPNGSIANLSRVSGYMLFMRSDHVIISQGQLPIVLGIDSLKGRSIANSSSLTELSYSLRQTGLTISPNDTLALDKIDEGVVFPLIANTSDGGWRYLLIERASSNSYSAYEENATVKFPLISIKNPIAVYNLFHGFVIVLPFKLPIFIQKLAMVFNLSFLSDFNTFLNWRNTFGAVGWFWLCVLAWGLTISLIKSLWEKHTNNKTASALSDSKEKKSV